MARVPEAVPAAPDTHAIEPWLLAVRAHVQVAADELLRLFDTFANEARFAHEWLQSSLVQLPRGATVLEVGAGLGLLSCQLVREGFRVVALEPIGQGFSSFDALQRLVLTFARSQGLQPEILPSRVEDLGRVGSFDFAFSVNVMEHVDDVPLALERLGRALRPGAVYRFTCPNYSFPYEPHFNIPTLLSKRLTERVFRHRILHSTQIEDQAGLWRSLNWISVRQVRAAVRRQPRWHVWFDTSMISRTFERVGSDPAFAARRSAWLVRLARWLVRTRLHRLLAWVPATLQPVIDCHLRREPDAANLVPAGAIR